MKKLSLILLTLFLLMFVGSLFLADLRTDDIKNNTQSKETIQYAQDLLNKSIQKQGFDKIDAFKTYEVTGTDNWKGMLGKVGNPWSWNNDKVAFRFSVGDFDSQVEVLDGEQKGFVAGIQSWDYYEKEGANYQTNVKDNGGIMFTLAAYHYFFELATRLAQAPFIRYAGKDQFKGKEMEKIFVSWGNEKTKAYDQYLLWIGKESGLIEATAFTTRDSPQPTPGLIYGSMRFDDYREVDGILIPFKQSAQLFDPKENTKEFIHQFTIDNFEWDKFPISDIRPIPNVKSIGDDKPQS